MFDNRINSVEEDKERKFIGAVENRAGFYNLNMLGEISNHAIVKPNLWNLSKYGNITVCGAPKAIKDSIVDVPLIFTTSDRELESWSAENKLRINFPEFTSHSKSLEYEYMETVNLPLGQKLDRNCDWMSNSENFKKLITKLVYVVDDDKLVGPFEKLDDSTGGGLRPKNKTLPVYDMREAGKALLSLFDENNYHQLVSWKELPDAVDSMDFSEWEDTEEKTEDPCELKAMEERFSKCIREKDTQIENCRASLMEKDIQIQELKSLVSQTQADKKGSENEAEMQGLKEKLEEQKLKYKTFVQMNGEENETFKKKLYESLKSILAGEENSPLEDEIRETVKVLITEEKASEDAEPMKLENQGDKISNIKSAEELVDFVYNELVIKGKRIMNRNDVASILINMGQNLLTILSGPNGSGKSSAAYMLAHICGLDREECRRYFEVAVGRNWLSSNDFTGTYDVFHKKLQIPNKAMDRVLRIGNVEACSGGSEAPLWVLLDEANLSSPDNYFSQFYNQCDLDKPNRFIEYSSEERFRISNALRFIATINTDMSTRLLSNRILSRAAIIKMPPQKIDINDLSRPELDESYPIVPQSLMDEFRYNSKRYGEKLSRAVYERYSRIAELFLEEGISIDIRAMQMIKDFCLVAEKIMDFGGNEFCGLDYAVAQHMLPLINMDWERGSSFISKLLRLCSNMPVSAEILESILKKGERNEMSCSYFEM